MQQEVAVGKKVRARTRELTHATNDKLHCYTLRIFDSRTRNELIIQATVHIVACNFGINAKVKVDYF